MAAPFVKMTLTVGKWKQELDCDREWGVVKETEQPGPKFLSSPRRSLPAMRWEAVVGRCCYESFGSLAAFPSQPGIICCMFLEGCLTLFSTKRSSTAVLSLLGFC